MKYLIQAITILLLCLCIYQNSYAQSKDSIAIQDIGYLKQQLSLTDNQYTSVKDIYVTLLNVIDNKQALTVHPEQRSIHLTQTNTNYRTALQHILTTAQWNTYETACAKTQQMVEQHLQEQKIKYTLLKTQ